MFTGHKEGYFLNQAFESSFQKHNDLRTNKLSKFAVIEKLGKILFISKNPSRLFSLSIHFVEEESNFSIHCRCDRAALCLNMNGHSGKKLS